MLSNIFQIWGLFLNSYVTFLLDSTTKSKTTISKNASKDQINFFNIPKKFLPDIDISKFILYLAKLVNWYGTINNVTLSFISSQNVNHLNFSFDIMFHPLTDCFSMNELCHHISLGRISIFDPLGFMIELFFAFLYKEKVSTTQIKLFIVHI